MLQEIKIGNISTSKVELVELAKAWIAISIAFGVAMGGFSLGADFLLRIALAAVTVGVGFLFHELAHKVVAQRYGCFAEFRAFDMMLILAVAFSFIGFIFAAPGAVMIAGQVTRRENGLISAAGPWMNIVLALVFFGLSFIFPALGIVWQYGFAVNSWLALFNMIPFFIFDGEKIFRWDVRIWGATTAVAAALVFLF